MEVVWSDFAYETYFKVIKFLDDYWSESLSYDFENNVEDLIFKIENFNFICPMSKISNFHKCTIDSYNSMIYTLVNNKVLIISFVDNRSNHIF